MCKETAGTDDMESELGFLAAMQAYKNAQASGDPEAIKAAEDAWREQVRNELMGK